MKKYFKTAVSLFCISAMALAFSACQSKSGQSAGSSTTSTRTSSSKKEVQAPISHSELLALEGKAVSSSSMDPSELTSKSWVLETLGGDTLNQASYMQMPTLQFDANSGRVSGVTPVNNYSSGYTLSGTSLTFGMAVSTRKAGPQADMELEHKFTRIFTTVSGWRIADGKLALLSGDTVLATFREKAQ